MVALEKRLCCGADESMTVFLESAHKMGDLKGFLISRFKEGRWLISMSRSENDKITLFLSTASLRLK